MHIRKRLEESDIKEIFTNLRTTALLKSAMNLKKNDSIFIVVI